MADLLLRAGQVEVTPSAPGPLAGYVARGDRPSTGTRDALVAALVLLEGRGERTGWLTIDAIAVTAELAHRLRETVRAAVGDPALPLAVTASHTHSAPLGWVGSIHPGHPGAVDGRAVDELLGRVGALARTLAASPAQPVTAAFGTGHAPGLGTNRNAVGTPHDDGVGVLALRTADQLAALLVDAAVHPTVLGHASMRWSADWPGAMRRHLQRTLAPDGQPPVVAFLQGAAGDVSTRFTRRPGEPGEVERLGAVAAAAVADALGGAAALTGPVVRRETVVRMPRRPLPDPAAAAAELEAATTARRALDGVPGLDERDPQVRLAQVRLDGAALQLAMTSAGTSGDVAMPVSAVGLGPVVWLHLPVEPFQAVAAAIRAACRPIDVRVVGYTDGYAGYLVDDDAAHAGTYEALASLFAPAATAMLVQRSIDLVRATVAAGAVR